MPPNLSTLDDWLLTLPNFLKGGHRSPGLVAGPVRPAPGRAAPRECVQLQCLIEQKVALARAMTRLIGSRTVTRCHRYSDHQSRKLATLVLRFTNPAI